MQNYIIAEIIKATHNNRNFVIISATNSRVKYPFISELCKYGFLHSYVCCGNYLILKIKIQHWKNWSLNIKPIIDIKQYRFNKQGTISAFHRLKYNKLKGNACCNFTSTDKGVITNHSQRGIGGIPLFTIK